MNQTERALSLAREVGGKSGLNCIAELDPTAAEQAKLMEESGYCSLPLCGVPVLVKDNIDVKGLHTTAGSLALKTTSPCQMRQSFATSVGMAR